MKNLRLGECFDALWNYTGGLPGTTFMMKMDCRKEHFRLTRRTMGALLVGARVGMKFCDVVSTKLYSLCDSDLIW